VENIAWVPREPLIVQVKEHPDDYISTMPELVKILITLGD